MGNVEAMRIRRKRNHRAAVKKHPPEGGSMVREVWCVAWRDPSKHIQWCATATGKTSDPSAMSVRTRCDHYVILPAGLEKRAPTCRACLKELS